MKSIFSTHWYLVAAIWFTVNGVLHDFFIVRNHKGPYDRDLLRLLMDGHVLILSGIIFFLCWKMAQANITYAFVIALVLDLGMIVYCAMIFPFLKSFVTLALSIFLTLVSIYQLSIKS